MFNWSLRNEQKIAKTIMPNNHTRGSKYSALTKKYKSSGLSHIKVKPYCAISINGLELKSPFKSSWYKPYPPTFHQREKSYIH